MLKTGNITTRYILGVLRKKMNGSVQIAIGKSNRVCDQLLLLQCTYL